MTFTSDYHHWTVTVTVYYSRSFCVVFAVMLILVVVCPVLVDITHWVFVLTDWLND